MLSPTMFMVNNKISGTKRILLSFVRGPFVRGTFFTGGGIGFGLTALKGSTKVYKTTGLMLRS